MSICVIEQFNAGADLSSSQYLAVYRDGADTENVKAATSAVVLTFAGILQNAPADDEAADVLTFGHGKALAGEALEPGDFLTIGSDSRMDKWAPGSGEVPIGQYLPKPGAGTNGRDAANGDEIRVFLFGSASALDRKPYLTTSGTLDFGTVASVGSGPTTNFSDLTVAVTNAVVGDGVQANPSATTLLNGSAVSEAWVSAAGVVTIRLKNVGQAAYDGDGKIFNITLIPAMSHP